MKSIASDRRGGEFLGDLQLWMRANAADNGEVLARLRRNLRLARTRELTPRQQQVVTMYFDEERSVTQIARELGVNPSTVTRTLRRAKDRLRRCLRYGF